MNFIKTILNSELNDIDRILFFSNNVNQFYKTQQQFIFWKNYE